MMSCAVACALSGQGSLFWMSDAISEVYNNDHTRSVNGAVVLHGNPEPFISVGASSIFTKRN